jgi:hypothetical protein
MCLLAAFGAVLEKPPLRIGLQEDFSNMLWWNSAAEGGCGTFSDFNLK